MELPTFFVPTAHTSLLAVAETSEKKPPLERDGVGITLQFVPSKCTASGCCVPLTVDDPTAQMSLSAIAAVATKLALLNCATTWKLVDVAAVMAVTTGSPLDVPASLRCSK
jgi:hypothetical protein